MAIKAKTVQVGNNADGRIEIFYTGLDDILYHDWQLPNGHWIGQNVLGPGDPVKAKQITVGNNEDGRCRNVLYRCGRRHLPQLAAEAEWLLDRRNLLGPGEPSKAKQIDFGECDGRIELFYIGLDDIVYHNWQLVPNGKWIGQNLLGPGEPARAKQIVAGRNQDGRIEVFYVGADDILYHNWQLVPNGKWIGPFTSVRRSRQGETSRGHAK